VGDAWGDAVGEGVSWGFGVGRADGALALRLKATPRLRGPGRSLCGSNSSGCFSGVLSPQLCSLVITRGVSLIPPTELVTTGWASG